jgi:hypothetical protein
MEDWNPSRGFAKEELRKNVLVVYYKRVVTASTSHEDGGDQSDESSPSPSEERSHEAPQRVQINSRPLLTELEFMTGTNMPKTPCIMIPPFKVFISCRDQIEREVATKRAKLSKAAAKKEDSEDPPVGPPTSEEAKAEKETDRERKAADHLECLLKFIDTELVDRLQLHRDIANKIPTSIALKTSGFYSNRET